MPTPSPLIAACPSPWALSTSLVQASAPAAANPVDLKGKAAMHVVATAPCGSDDMHGRVVAENMQKQLPVSTFVVKTEPGAGHIAGANASIAAKPDAPTIGSFIADLIHAQMTGREGVKFDLTRISWIGKASSEPRVPVVSAQPPVDTCDDLEVDKESVRFVVSGVGSRSRGATKPLANTLKLPIEIIPNYAGSDGEMAMHRGEVLASVGSRLSFESFGKNGHGRFLFQIGDEDDDMPPPARLVTDLSAKALLARVQGQGDLARLTAGPPGIPAERLEVLRSAHQRALANKGLQGRPVMLGLPLNPDCGDNVLEQVHAALKQSKPSGIRAPITIDDKNARRGDLQVSMHREIRCKIGINNEPVELACK